MKRNILLLFAFFLIGLNAISQNTLGLKAGINWAYQTNLFTSTTLPRRTMQTKPLLGYHFGIFYKAKISKKLAFSTEANFSLVGAKDLYQSLPLDGDTAFVTHYYNNKIGNIEVPLMIQYNLNRIYVSAGPSLSLKLFSKSMLSNNTLYYKSFDVAGNLLAGYHVSKKWDVNLRYSYGLLNINKDPAIAATKKNRYLSLSLLYALK